MLAKIWDDPLYRFLLKAVFLFLGWTLLYEVWLHPSAILDLAVIGSLEDLSSFVLSTLGYHLIADSDIPTMRTVGIDGTSGLWIGDPCNGITLFSIFTIFVLAFPGKWTTRLWFIPLGLLIIHGMNVLRIVALAILILKFPDPAVLDFNHTYTFTILVYSVVFALWYVWATKLSSFELLKKKK